MAERIIPAAELANPKNYQGQSLDDRREQELREIDQYDIMNPELFYPYVERLEKAASFLDKHIMSDKGGDVRRTLLDYSGLAGGETNFWANPYESTGITSRQAKNLTFDRNYADIWPMKDAVAYTYANRPYNINFNPGAQQKQEYPTSRLLAHEIGHSKAGLHQMGAQMGMSVGSLRPNWSEAFWQDLAQLKGKKGAYFGGSGFGEDPEETMAYLIGREGELRKGKTLLDDPESARVFRKHPGSYEEYSRIRDTLRKFEGRTR